MNYRELIAKLRALGCEHVRPAAGSHEVWWNPGNKKFTTIPKHANRDLATGTLRAIVRDLGLNKRDFDRA